MATKRPATRLKSFTILNTTKSGVTWAQDSKGKQFILCRECRENPCDFFDPSRSLLSDGYGWVEEYHVCTSCSRKRDAEKARKSMEEYEARQERRRQEYEEYMDEFMRGVE